MNKNNHDLLLKGETKVLNIVSLWLLPTLFGAGFITSLFWSKRVWWVAKVTTLLSLATVLLVATATATKFVTQSVPGDTLGILMAALIALLSWVIVGFSQRYLGGEPKQIQYVRSILFTLSCVAVLITSHNIALIAIAWSATSVGLHYLLTFYSQRKAAQIVAHKKFIVSRLADLCLLIAVLLIYRSVGSVQLDELRLFIAQNALTSELNVAALLFVLAAILKTAQLPLHGWLIQVMEAPTPVSALLHAGVVNMGGFVLLRLADLIGLAVVAQWMLIIVGGLTALLAGVVMMTRVSIKVRLAWSTCAQMGFMLMEIGLGLYELALLHLIAHSLYKAYAFLSSGEIVEQTFITQMQGKNKLAPWMLISAPLVAAGVILGLLVVWHWMIGLELPLLVLAILVLGFAPLLWSAQSVQTWLTGLLRVSVLTQIYFVFHWVFGLVVTPQPIESTLVTVWVMGLFVLLYCAQVAIVVLATNPIVQKLYWWAYHGFFLDETFTRLTFKYWPARFSPLQAQTSVNRVNSSAGDVV